MPALRLNRIDLFTPLVFLYLATLHADQLSLAVGGYTVRVHHAIALVVLAIFLLRFRYALLSIDKAFCLALVFIAFSILLSLLLSPYKQRCLLFFGWFSLTLVCNVALPYVLCKFWDGHKFFSLYCLSTLFVGLYALLQLLISGCGVHDPFAHQYLMGDIVRPNAFSYEPSFYALYMTPFVLMANYHKIFAPGKPFFCFPEVTIKFVIFINVLYLISFSSSAIFSYSMFFLLVLVIAWRRGCVKRALCFIASFFAGGAIFFVCTPFLWKKFFLKFFFFGFMSHGSFYERWVGLCNAWQVFLEHPWVGVGLGGLPSYLYEAWLSGRKSYSFFEGTLTNMPEINYYKYFEAMNVFTEVLASLGIIGLIAFASFVFLFLLKAKRAFHKNPLLVGNIFVTGIVLLIILQFNQGLLRTYIWNFFGMAFALMECLITEKEPVPFSQEEALYNWREKRPVLGSFYKL